MMKVTKHRWCRVIFDPRSLPKLTQQFQTLPLVKLGRSITQGLQLFRGVELS